MQVAVPSFIAKAFGMNDRHASSLDDIQFLMDEECYLGRDGNLDHCADFDPPHNEASP